MSSNDIEKIALGYLYGDYGHNSEPTQEQKVVKTKRMKRNRAALQRMYEAARVKYTKEKKVVENLREEGSILQKKFDEHKTIMNKNFAKMEKLRELLIKMDNSGNDYVEIEQIIEDEEN